MDWDCHDNSVKVKKAKKKHFCSTCGTGFAKRCDLIRHERIHTGEKPYTCDLCGASFSQSFSLKIHFRKHTGEKPFQCKLCPQSFAHSHRLKAHIAKCHAPSPLKCNVCSEDKHSVEHTPSSKANVNHCSTLESQSQDQPSVKKNGPPDHLGKSKNGKRHSKKDKSTIKKQESECVCNENNGTQNPTTKSCCDCNDFGCSVKLNKFQVASKAFVPPTESFMCDVCGLFFVDSIALSDHLQAHKENNVDSKLACCSKNLVGAPVLSELSVTCGDKVCLMKNPIFVIQEAFLNQGLRVATPYILQNSQLDPPSQREKCSNDISDEKLSKDAKEIVQKDGQGNLNEEGNSPNDRLESPLSSLEDMFENFPTFQDHFLSETEDKVLLNDQDDSGNNLLTDATDINLEKFLAVKPKPPILATGQNIEEIFLNGEIGNKILEEFDETSHARNLHSSLALKDNLNIYSPVSVIDTDSKQEDGRGGKNNFFLAKEKDILHSSNEEKEKEISLLRGHQNNFRMKPAYEPATKMDQVVNWPANANGDNSNLQFNNISNETRNAQTEIDFSFPFSQSAAVSCHEESSILQQPLMSQIMTTSNNNQLVIGTDMNLKENCRNTNSLLNFSTISCSLNHTTTPVRETSKPLPRQSLLPSPGQILIVHDNNNGPLMLGSLSDLSKSGQVTNPIFDNNLIDPNSSMNTVTKTHSLTQIPLHNEPDGSETLFGRSFNYSSQSMTAKMASSCYSNPVTKPQSSIESQIFRQAATSFTGITSQNMEITAPGQNELSIKNVLNSQDTEHGGDVLFPMTEKGERSLLSSSPYQFLASSTLLDIISKSTSSSQTMTERSLPEKSSFSHKMKSSNCRSLLFSSENMLSQGGDILALHGISHGAPANGNSVSMSNPPAVNFDFKNMNKADGLLFQTKTDQSHSVIMPSSITEPETHSCMMEDASLDTNPHGTEMCTSDANRSDTGVSTVDSNPSGTESIRGDTGASTADSNPSGTESIRGDTGVSTADSNPSGTESIRGDTGVSTADSNPSGTESIRGDTGLSTADSNPSGTESNSGDTGFSIAESNPSGIESNSSDTGTGDTNEISHDEEKAEKPKCTNCPLGLLDSSVISVLCEDECFGDMIERNLSQDDRGNTDKSETANEITGLEPSNHIEQPDIASLNQEISNTDKEKNVFEIEDQSVSTEVLNHKKNLLCPEGNTEEATLFLQPERKIDEATNLVHCTGKIDEATNLLHRTGKIDEATNLLKPKRKINKATNFLRPKRKIEEATILLHPKGNMDEATQGMNASKLDNSLECNGLATGECQNDTEQVESLKEDVSHASGFKRKCNSPDNVVTSTNKTSSVSQEILKTSVLEAESHSEPILRLRMNKSKSILFPQGIHPAGASNGRVLVSMGEEIPRKDFRTSVGNDSGIKTSAQSKVLESVSKQIHEYQDIDVANTSKRIFSKSSNVKKIQKKKYQKRKLVNGGSEERILSECKVDQMVNVYDYKEVGTFSSIQNSSENHLREVCGDTMHCHCHESLPGKHPDSCPISHITFLFQRTLDTHLEKSLGENTGAVKLLEMSASNSMSAAFHQLQASFSYLSLFTTSNPKSYTVHQQRMEVQIPSKIRYLCQVCGEFLSSLSTLNHHMKSHSQVSSYNCDTCPAEFHKKNDLVKHRRIHSDHRPYKCNICSRSFTQKTNLHIHMRIHTGERPYSCTICSARFAHSQALKIHMRFHLKDTRHTCQECGRGFVVRAALEKHKRSHTGERPFVCKICNSKMSSRSSLSRHQKRHLGNEFLPFPCSLCPLRFAKSNYLNLHMKSHGVPSMKKA